MAPDYLLVQEYKIDAVVESLKQQFNHCLNDIAANLGYTAIINQHHYDRLQGYLADAQQKGARIIPLADDLPENPLCKMPLTLVLNVTEDMKALKEEIFGAILPIVSYQTFRQAIDYINDHDRPLALYYFDANQKRVQQVLDRTVSGNACINEALMHVYVDDLPFGEIGASGMGAYHGRERFVQQR